MVRRRLCGIVLLLLFWTGSLSLSFAQKPDSNYQSLVSGMEEYKKGDYGKALNGFLEAEKLFPKDADIPFYLGLTYLQQLFRIAEK